MHVDEYDFGHIRIDGVRYNSDVIISPEKVRDHWWRAEGHRLQIGDLDAVLSPSTRILIVGTGYYGRMVVPNETRDHIVSSGVQVIAARTGDAVAEFNRLQRDCANVVAALHLTC